MLKMAHYQRCAIWSAIVLGTIYWPYFSENPNIFIAIAIGLFFDFKVFHIWSCFGIVGSENLNIGLYSVYYWYCVAIVHFQTLF